MDFESVVGCPREIFEITGVGMARAKEFKLGQIEHEPLEETLVQCERRLREWDGKRTTSYPSPDPDWPYVAEAFRHACILRMIRYVDTWATADDPKIQASVSAILDACSGIGPASPLLKRLLLPLFMAGADSLSWHQRHYVLIRIHDISNQTGFRNPTAIGLLHKVWSARAAQAEDDRTNVPWMEFVGSKSKIFFVSKMANWGIS